MPDPLGSGIALCSAASLTARSRLPRLLHLGSARCVREEQLLAVDRRHFVAPIGPQERDGWLLCFERAPAEIFDNPALREAILQPVRRLADHMQNKS